MSTDIGSRPVTRKQYQEYCKYANKNFIDSHIQAGRFYAIEYLRTPERWERLPDKRFRRHRGEPWATVIAVEYCEGGLVFGWSCVHKTKDTFIKRIGLTKALNRAVSDALDGTLSVPPERMVKMYNEFQGRAAEEFARFLFDRGDG